MSKEKLDRLFERLNSLTTGFNKVLELVGNLNERLEITSKRLEILELNATKELTWYPTDKAIVQQMELNGCSWEEASIKLKEEHEKADGV